MHPASLLIRALDLVGTFVFAVSGAMVGVHRRMDLFGVLVLAFVTAVFGGITRDVLIGIAPSLPPSPTGMRSRSPSRQGCSPSASRAGSSG